MPYRIDIPNPPDDALDALVDLGALDVDVDAVAGALAAILPDTVAPEAASRALGGREVRVSRAVGRDDDSVWVLTLRPFRVGSLVFAPADLDAGGGVLRLTDGSAFGTGLHATTVLCLEALDRLLDAEIPSHVLDVGTGSGILALAALHRGVQRVTGLDISDAALRAAARNAQLNGFDRRLRLVRGEPDCLRGAWPLVVANVRAAELMAMAPMLTRRIASKGQLVLSGIPDSVAPEVERSYRRLGMTQTAVTTRGGWSALGFRVSW